MSLAAAEGTTSLDISVSYALRVKITEVRRTSVKPAQYHLNLTLNLISPSVTTLPQKA